MDARKLSLFIAAAMVLATSLPAHAALISFTNAALSSNGAEITNLGVVVYAWNVGGNEGATPTINGITFTDAQPANITGGPTNVLTDYANNQAIYDSTMDEIMEDFRFSNQPQNTILTIAGLTVGQLYQVQFTHHQQDGGAGFRDMEVHFGTLATDPGSGAFGAQNPRISTALFTADATSQSFLVRTGGNDRSIINSISVTTIPTPAALPAALALLGLAALRRRSA